MTMRTRLAWSLAAALVSIATALAGAPQRLVRAQDSAGRVVDRQLERRARRRPPPHPRLVAHEWGVWLLEQGRVAHLDALAAESPPFVMRAPGHQLRPPPPRPPLPPPRPPVVQPQPQPQPPRPPNFPAVARKPVIFLRAPRPVDVTVEVGFLGGAPWLYYPHAQVLPTGPTPGSRSLLFDGRLLPRAQTALAPVPRGHWWNELRAAGGHTFVSHAGTSESFLFYDGPVAFQRSFLIAWQGRGAQVTRTGTESRLFLVDRGRFTESEVETRGSRVLGEGDMATLRQRLEAQLLARGLTPGEARSLLATWRDELFGGRTARALYFVSRAEYDRMLPIRITPAPTELVRVGLVIEDLGGFGPSVPPTP